MADKPKPARELAARALCRINKQNEETVYEGKPMWQSYLGAADLILDAIGWKKPELLPVYRTREVKSEE